MVYVAVIGRLLFCWITFAELKSDDREQRKVIDYHRLAS